MGVCLRFILSLHGNWGVESRDDRYADYDGDGLVEIASVRLNAVGGC